MAPCRGHKELWCGEDDVYIPLSRARRPFFVALLPSGVKNGAFSWAEQTPGYVCENLPTAKIAAQKWLQRKISSNYIEK